LPAAFDCNRILEIDEMTRNGSKAGAPAASASFSDDAVQALSASFTRLLADMFALYLKTKNFHWHVSGPHFRDYHLLLDYQKRADFRDDGRDRRAGHRDGRGRVYDQRDICKKLIRHFELTALSGAQLQSCATSRGSPFSGSAEPASPQE
jgi:hypothetical protein